MIPFKKRQLPALLLLPYLSNGSYALSVGEPSLQSTLGAPLLLEIPLAELNNLSAEQLKVSLADSLDFRRLGVEPKPLHQQLKFETVIAREKAYISVSSRDATNEPYVSFVIRIQWPQGSLIQRYTLFIDPAPAAKPTPYRVVRKHDAGRSRFASTVETRNGDSLWLLARRVQRPQGSNIAQVMNALYRINRHAFVGGNADKLIAGVPIKTPSAAQINAQARQFEVDASSQPDTTPGTGQEARAAAGGHADSRNGAAAAITPGSSKASIVDPNMQDQLEGIKAGIAAAEAGKVRTQGHIDVLEQELNALVERYKVISDKARDLEQSGARKTGSEMSMEAANSTSDNSNFLLSFSGIMTGFAGAGYLLGQALSAKKPAKSATLNKCSWLTSWSRTKPGGSDTFERPFSPQIANTPVVSCKMTGNDVSSNPGDSADAEDPGLVAAAYLAFAMYEEAQNTLSQGILDYPGRADLQMQLLELYCNTAMHAKFEDMAASMLASCDDAAVTARVELLRMQLPDDAPSAAADAINLQRRAG